MSRAAPAPAAGPAPRSFFVTVVAWLTIVAGAVLTPISVLSFLMILARSHGTSTFDPVGFLVVVAGPPAAVVVGIGLLRRKRWAHFCLLALLLVALGDNLYRLVRGPTPQSTTISAGGVPTTTLATPVSGLALPAIVASAGLIVALLTRGVRSEFSPAESTRPN